MSSRLWSWAGRIRVRLLIVNLFLVLVPSAGLEFARLYERQLLSSLERDMQNQAALLAQSLLSDLERGIPLAEPTHERTVERAARTTRTRLRVIGRDFAVLVDSHKRGPPEGREPMAPALTRLGDTSRSWLGADSAEGPEIPLKERRELKAAIGGSRSTATRLRANPPAVLLFLAHPISDGREVVGVVYVTRSTQPVLVEMHRIRSGLLAVLGAAIALAALIAVLLAWSLTRPIERLASAARQIASGQRSVRLPIGGGGEITELSCALGEMTEQLQARQRYVAEFAADVAHEFKSPLTSILGAAELLAEGAADDPNSRARFLRNILLDAERLEQLVSRLLELSRVEASDEPLTKVSLDALIRKAVERCENPDQTIRYVPDGASYEIRGRPRDLEMALLNLLDNALRHSPPTQSVTVEIRRDESQQRVGIAVIDRGSGIALELQSKVFERFYTTNSQSGGTGLGLSIVSSVAQAHGGHVELISGVGQGAVFVLWLPRWSSG